MAPTRYLDAQRLERVRKLTEVSRALTYATSIEEVLELAVERAAELVAADRALIMLTDTEGLLTVRAAYGIDESRTTEFRERLSESLVRRLQGLLGYPAEECFLSVPLVARGEVCGLLAAVRPVVAESAEDEEWLLSALADQTAVALENARLMDAVNAERSEVDRVVEAEGRTHATLGHELRSPLTAVQSYASLLLDGVFGPITDRQREAVSRIRLSGRHILFIIENVLDAARIRAGKIEISSTTVRVADVLAQALQILQPMAVSKQQELRVDTSDALLVQADSNRLRQAFLNLVGNAIKYSPKSGTIRIEASSNAGEAGPFAAVAVTDNGPGIPPDTLEEIFEPYYRGGASGQESGLGLGLFISRELIRQMGGDIRVRSEIGEGSTFTVLLPLS